MEQESSINWLGRAAATVELEPRISFSERMATLLAVVVPLIGVAVAIVLAWGSWIGWLELSLLLSMYLLTGLGITVGYHRLFTHRSFETIRPIRFILAVLGSMSVEGPLLRWVAVHRRHHQHSDSEDDPHSPHHHGGGVAGVLTGLWHAHVGWMFTARHPNLSRYVKDLNSDRLMRMVSEMFPMWVLLGLLIPTAVGGLLTGTWTGALLGFLWGGLVRIFLVHHITWSINSVCHVWGRRPFQSSDHSRNNAICGVLAFGEGWHNNHHAFPTSARHGLAWWQFDLSYVVIRVLEIFKLAWHVRVPSPENLDAKRTKPDGA